MTTRSVRSVVLLLCVAVSGCYVGPYDEEEPPVRSVGPAKTSSPRQMGIGKVGSTLTNDEKVAELPNADGSQKRKYHGISFLIPKEWSEIRLSSAQQTVINSKYKIPTEKGDLELTLTNMGGGWESNLDRWAVQMGQQGRGGGERESISVDGVESHWVDVKGDYVAKFNDAQGPHTGFRLVGGVIRIKPQDFTLKLLGPSEAVADYHDKFMEFVKTAKVGG